MDIQKIKEHLENGGTVLVDNLWYFTKDSMECEVTKEDDEYICCEDHYSEVEEALQQIHYFSENGELEIDLLW
ncbi:MAG: hypothetical protein GOVbin1096_101 [Prokaryotic dsDNA virus sp.]|jgi:hypothetical protein|nr:MAG: hypothetical protein GOVbin1096_101 [Prokaryotic dsDNA virus sp.]|tara:strand:+ start:22004 stop:22222 length:219 start_codon:yes stop_codon:yes gene_type:complete